MTLIDLFISLLIINILTSILLILAIFSFVRNYRKMLIKHKQPEQLEGQCLT